MQFSNGTTAPTKAPKLGKGVFIDLVEIVGVENRDSTWNDINLFIKTIADFNGFNKDFFLGGNHLKEGEEFKGWGSTKDGVKNGSWKVSQFIEVATGMKSSDIVLNSNGTLADKTIEALIGKKLHILQYESTSGYRDTWFYFGNGTEEGKTFLADKWNNQNSLPFKYKHQDNTDTATEIWNTTTKTKKNGAVADGDFPF